MYVKVSQRVRVCVCLGGWCVCVFCEAESRRAMLKRAGALATVCFSLFRLFQQVMSHHPMW